MNKEGIDSNFLGYELDKLDAMIVDSGENLLILNTTPFYAESGGQVGDQGWIVSNNETFIVTDTHKVKIFTFIF